MHTSTRFYRSSRLSALMLGASLLGLQPAAAQSVEPAPPAADQAADGRADADSMSEVVVTGTRLDRRGFEAPSPTTVINAADIQTANRANIALVVADLPSVRATFTPQNTSANIPPGTSTIDLRGLGDSRTLVLVNGRRFSGSIDLNTLPMTLVKSVNLVTGGASAAWGSGAVAGVVNIILDDAIEGLAANTRIGISSRGDGAQYYFDARYGTSFADGAGHVMIAAEHLIDKGILDRNSRFGLAAGVLPNPAYTATNGQAPFVLYPDVNYANANATGIITSGVLAGNTFNQDGTLRPFVFGSPRTAGLMVGGEGENSSDRYPIFPPSKRTNVYGRATYDIGSAKLWIDAGYARYKANIDSRAEFNLGNLAISAQNAYLRPEIRQQLAQAGQTSFLLGRLFNDYGLFNFNSDRVNFDGAAGIDGSFAGGKWRYSVYGGYGSFRDNSRVRNLIRTANFNQAVDSVIGPNGTPICRIALTDPTTACRPLNVFGAGNADPVAVANAFGAASYHSVQRLYTYGASLRGDPFTIFARPVSLAVGIEGRRESIGVTVDPLSQAGAFRTLNFAPLNGAFNVKEAFAEVAVPIVNIDKVAVADFNGAVRYSDYSNSGGITSWKLGASGKFFDLLRLRAVRSRDIRSANLMELFTLRGTTTAVIIDPRNNQPTPVVRFVGGNPDLEPEIGKTWTLGAGLEPSFLPGFNFAVDYYNIKIAGAITSLAAQDIVNGCAAGSTALCDLFTRDAAGNIGDIQATFVNIARYSTKGVDFDLAYTTPLDRLFAGAPGQLRFRALATRAIRTVIDTGVVKFQRVGVVGDTSTFNTPKWQGSASLTYVRPGAALDVRLRYVGGGIYSDTVNVQNSDISSRLYTDLGVSLDIARKLTWALRVNNVFDVKPPLISYRSPFYDTIGTFYTMSVGVKF